MMEHPPIIGLLGKREAGKDSLGAIMVERYGCQRFAFADRLKAVLEEINPITDAALGWRLSDEIRRGGGWDGAKQAHEVRRLLQTTGEAMRGIDPWIWAQKTLVEIQEATGPVVVTDVRHPEEAWALGLWGATLVRVIRPGTDTGDTHPSETALDDWPVDLCVHNDGTLEDLASDADVLAEMLGLRR